MDQERIELSLDRAPDDPRVNDPKFQEELRELSTALHTAGAIFSQRSKTRDAIGAHGYLLAEYAIKYLAPAAVSAVAMVLGIWLRARYGRKVSLKIGEIEAEAHIPEEVEKLLQSAIELQTRLIEPRKEPR